MINEKHFCFFFNMLQDAEKQIGREAEKQVMIEKAINLRLMCDYVVSCSYGDIVLIICMLHDYINMLDKIKAEDLWYQSYYRKVFAKIADRLANQIGYDYEAALEKCKKKHEKEDSSSDVGEEAMALVVKRGIKEARKKEEKPEKEENKSAV